MRAVFVEVVTASTALELETVINEAIDNREADGNEFVSVQTLYVSEAEEIIALLTFNDPNYDK